LADIIENAEQIEQYLLGLDRAAFATSHMTRDAVERCLSEDARRALATIRAARRNS